MTIKKASEAVEELEFVESAGAAPTDVGNVPCFQVELTHGAYMDEEHMRQIEKKIRERIGDSFRGEGELVVQTSGEEIDGTFYVWALTYKPYAEFENSGIEYNVVYHNDELVCAVPTDTTHPENIEVFNWKEIPIDEVDY